MRQPTGRGGSLYGLWLMLCMGWSLIGQAEDIAPLKLTDTEGYVLVDFLYDGLASERGGESGSSEQQQAVLREEIFLLTHSYVYHPNFLTMDVGGGPIFQNVSVDFDGNREDADEILYNFTSRANFLRNKPVRGALFYDHLNPTMSVAPGEIMVQENDRYGFDVFLSNPLLELPINFGFVHTQTEGDSANRTQRDAQDQFYVDISRSYGGWGSSSLKYQAAEQTSSSGSLDLPIQETRSTNQGLNANTRLQFGADQRYNLSNNITYNTRTYSQTTSVLPDQSDFGFLLDFRKRHSDKLNLFGIYHHNRNDQGDVNLVSQALSTGLNYLPLPDLETSIGLRLEKDDASQYTVDSQAVDGSVRYRKPLWAGELQASYSVRYELRDQQEASNSLIRINDEPHTLSGAIQVSLGQSYIQQDSVTVTNLSKSQTYIENVDYLLTVVGAETRIERLSSGSILDGETVLVSYLYDIGGTYASAQLDQTSTLNWNFSRYLSSYLRWFKSSPEITSGFSTYPLNPIDSVLLGTRAEVPMPFGIPFSVGGTVEYEKRDEIVSPYTRETGDIFLQTTRPLFGLLNWRLAGRRNLMEYEFSTQDIDLTGYELRLWTRHYGIELNGLVGYEEDTGGPIPRTRRDASLSAVWRERRLTVTATLLNSLEQQGDYERDHFLFRVTARRDI